jgi:hypothetical protein
VPKQSVKVEVNLLNKGLLTEASVLNFPAEATRDELNFVPQLKGSRRRRKGLAYQPSSSTFSIGAAAGPAPSIVNAVSFKWKDAGGVSGRDLICIRSGTNIYFFLASAVPLSSGFLNSVSISSFAITRPSWQGGSTILPAFSSTTIDGKLVFATSSANIGVITHNGSTGFTVSSATLKVRDLWGVQETQSALEADPSVNPATLTDTHYYNLQNQSWGLPRRKDDPVIFEDPVDQYFDEYANYPSNIQSIWAAMKFVPVTSTDDPYERHYPKFHKEAAGSGLAAARGYYIIDLLARGSSRAAAWAANKAKHPELNLITDIDLPTDTTIGGASIVKEFAGRVFYAGFNGELTDGDSRSPVLNNYIAFSQLVTKTDDIFKCYQAGDPTSRESNEIVDTDGGFIKIAGLNYVVALEVFRDSLLVFGGNGVWQIIGGSDFGFSAANYKVVKLSNKGCVSAGTVVEVNSDTLYWAQDGIYQVTVSQTGDAVVVSLTEKSIQTFYDSIPLGSKIDCKSCYCYLDRAIRWVYFDDEGFSRELVLYTNIGSFVLNKFFNTTPKIVDVFVPTEVSEVFYLVTSSGVVEGGHVRLGGFATLNNLDFEDFGQDAFAYLQTGSFTGGDAAISKQLPYLFLYFEKTETAIDAEEELVGNSSCKFRTNWDWAVSSNSNKITDLQEGYRYRRPYFAAEVPGVYDNGFEVVVSRNKVRGRGKAFSVYFETSPKKDCHILGWVLNVNGNSIA